VQLPAARGRKKHLAFPNAGRVLKKFSKKMTVKHQPDGFLIRIVLPDFFKNVLLSLAVIHILGITGVVFCHPVGYTG